MSHSRWVAAMFAVVVVVVVVVCQALGLIGGLCTRYYLTASSHMAFLWGEAEASGRVTINVESLTLLPL